MDDLVADLLANTGALGIWLLDHKDVVAGAVTDASIAPPAAIEIEGEAHLDLGDRQFFAKPIGDVTLVAVFDHRSSLGLVRLRIRNTKEAIEQAVVARRVPN